MAANGKLSKAILRVVEGTPSVKELRFTFNPTEYTITKSAQWNRPTTGGAKSATTPAFQGANPQTLQMEIFFDEYEAGGNVTAKVATLLEWLKPTLSSVNQTQPQPPILAFEWGVNDALKNFRGFLKSVTAKYTMFRGDGLPTRASANVSLEEVPLDAGKQNPTSGAIAGRSTHVLHEGDTLASIAYAEYGNAALWRGLAAFNDIDDPLRLKPGARILVPTMAEALRLA
ncbi:MAG: peptidase M23 [Chloroflexota bacterium]